MLPWSRMSHNKRKTHLEGKIGECVRNSGLGLVPTTSLEQDGDARRWLGIVDRSDLEARGSVYDGCKATF